MPSACLKSVRRRTLHSLTLCSLRSRFCHSRGARKKLINCWTKRRVPMLLVSKLHFSMLAGLGIAFDRALCVCSHAGVSLCMAHICRLDVCIIVGRMLCSLVSSFPCSDSHSSSNAPTASPEACNPKQSIGRSGTSVSRETRDYRVPVAVESRWQTRLVG